MTDDTRRPDEGADDAARKNPGPSEAKMDEFENDEFGGPLFGATSEQPVTGSDDSSGSAPLSFGKDDT